MNRKESAEKKETRLHDFPESQVGFPERNDATRPVETERVHVDLDTLNISRKSSRELDRELGGRTLDRE